jgi:putative hemolysin
MRELFTFAMKNEDMGRKIRDLDGLMRKPEFVPETHSIHTLFSQMQLQKNHLYIVIDEYGQTSGLITLEDILEEIVGNIQDEHDAEEGQVERLVGGSFRMPGSTPLSDVAKYLEIEFEEEDVDTLSGFMMLRYGSVPDDDDEIEISAYGWNFVAEKIKDHIVETALISSAVS